MENVELSIADILEIVTKRWRIILIIVILCASMAFLYSTYAIVPMYGLNVTFMVNPEFGNSQATTIVTETQSYVYAKDAITTYMKLLTNNEFFDLLQERIDGKCIENYSVGQLKHMVSFSNVTDTELFNATIVSPIPEDAYTIAQEMQELAPERIHQLRGFGVLKVVDKPQYKNIVRVNNNTFKYTFIGAFFGAIISALFFVLMKLIDVRITDESDVKKAYNIPILGIIPNFDEVTNGENEKPMYGGKSGENKK